LLGGGFGRRLFFVVALCVTEERWVLVGPNQGSSAQTKLPSGSRFEGPVAIEQGYGD
jgi:hypothetical protein